MGRSGTAQDEVGSLLRAAGNADAAAFAAFYDRTSPVIFNVLRRELDEPAAERATVRVYLRVWQTASAFDPARMSGWAFVLHAVYHDRRSRPR